jgi:hypothetical protein
VRDNRQTIYRGPEDDAAMLGERRHDKIEEEIAASDVAGRTGFRASTYCVVFGEQQGQFER